jgi:diguanylate cyclase (GGDEF)-like protein
MPQPNPAPSALRCLLVEPDTETLLMLELALSLRGQTVTSCQDARSAWLAACEVPFPLIVMNRQLPDADALRFCCEVRALPGGAQPVILIVASSPSDADRAAAIEAGADDYLAWPLNTDVLRQVLERAEQQVRRRREARPESGAFAANGTEDGGATGELFLVVNADGTIRRAGDVSEMLLGFPPGALAGVNAFSFFHTDDAPLLLSVLVEALARPERTRAVEVRVRRDVDTWRTITTSARNRLDDPAVGGIVFELRGPDAHVHVADQVTRSAMHDRVTNLPNRHLFIDRVDHAVTRATRRNLPVVVMAVDFNGFEPANGMPHSEVSEGLVVALAQRVRSCLRASDTAARLGHDEFALLLEDIVDPSNISIVANRIVQAMTVPFFDGGAEIELRPNIGVAVSTPDRCRAAELLHDANIARAWARVQGSGRHVMFDPSMAAPRDEPTTDQLDFDDVPQPPAPSPAASLDDRLVALNQRIASLEQTILKLDKFVSAAVE